jgi:cobalt-zinc-cadmium efflux system membrane fusion protein
MRLLRRLMLIAILAACMYPPTHASAQQARPDPAVLVIGNSSAAADIKMAPVRKKVLADKITATAIIEPEPAMVARVAPRIRARVVKVMVELGQAVKAGDALAVLSSIELGKAKTDYLKAQSLESIAAQHLDRENRLYQDKISSKKEVLNARANYDTALAELKASREFLRSLIGEADIGRIGWSDNQAQPLSEFDLVAPFAGIVVKRDLTQGAVIQDDADVITIMNLDRVRVLVNIFEHDLSNVRPGEPASVTVEAYPAERFTGTVASLGDIVDRTTRTVQARIDVPNGDHRLKPGMFANAEIVASRQSSAILSVPTSAIYELEGKKSVFIALSQGRFGVRPVTLGDNSGDEVQILAGLNEGDRVVIQGGLVLKAMMLNRASSY